MAKAKKLKSGNWRVLVYDYTDDSRKRHYKSFTAATKKDAEYMAAEYTINRSKSSFEDLTLDEAFERYIKSKSEILSPSTITSYKGIKKNHFGGLMQIKLAKLTPQMVQTAINELAAGHTPKTVRNAHGLLSAVLKAYYPQLQLNTTLPQKVKPKYIIPTTAEINKLLELANERIRVPILLASQGGLRRSEICALTPDDVTDLGVNVNKANVYNSERAIVTKTTKTTAGTRFVPLPPAVIDELRHWDYFGLSPAALSHGFDKLVAKSDVSKFSFHKLRHYFASELHAQGIPDQYIAQLGGWQTVDMLHHIYQHTLRDHEDEMSQKVLTIFNTNFKNATQNTTRNLKKVD